MPEDAVPQKRWNLFARALEDILRTHQYRLGHLDDRAGIDRPKVLRLQRSLHDPKHMPVLNPEEVERVVEEFGLTEEEALRLRASLLATAVERLLMDRLAPEQALLAAEWIEDLLLKALRTQAGVLAALRTGGGEMPEASELMGVIEAALEAIDRATLALHLSQRVDPRVRLSQLRLARDHFAYALEELEAAPAAIKGHGDWQVWHREATRGLIRVQRDLELLTE